MSEKVALQKSQKIADKLRQLRIAFQEQLTERMEIINSHYTALSGQPDNMDTLIQLRLTVHSLAGAGGTFGYQQLSAKAHDLEEILNPFVAESRIPDKDDLHEMSLMLQRLNQLATEDADNTINPYSGFAEHKLRVLGQNEKILVYIVEDDTHLADDMAIQLEQFGYETAHFENASLAVEALQKKLPSAMIIDIELPEGSLAGPSLVEKVTGLQQSSVPLIFMSMRTDWSARLASLRAGGAAYLVKPVDIADVVDQLDRLTGNASDEPYRVLVVEDVDVLAQHYALVLSGAGMEVSVINDPSAIIETLDTLRPELILMDLYMPGCTGMEAAKVVRQIPAYINVPIVFLSTESCVDQQMEAMRIGGDDFLTKPIRDDHLLAAVTIRAQRFRHLRSFMVRDSLTGLVNHITIELELERELSRAERDKTPLAYVMIDIDHFKSVNDTYGHPIGDRVLKSLSRMLVQRLRKSDIVGRYGGEEFGVILPGTSAKQAVLLLDKIREDFSHVPHVHADGTFTVSFSAGVAECPLACNLEDFIQMADNALYKAKEKGRNCIVCNEK